MPTLEELENRFAYHQPFGNQTERYNDIRHFGLNLSLIINDRCPESREKSLALTKLEETVMWANKSIAVNETKIDDKS